MSLVPETVLVPGGRFLMGSSSGRPDEAPVHTVDVGAFRIGRTPVTRAQYEAFLQDTRGQEPPRWSDPDLSWSPELPVVAVNWFEASAYAAWLTGCTGWTWRLPSEAEWERAVRGGLPSAPTAWGESLPPGEIPAGDLRGPWPAGRGTPNGFGLLDAGTIVHEWCLDWYRAEYYSASPVRDPRGPDEGERRSSRGGSWRHQVRFSPPSARSSLPPELHYTDYGFRVLQEL